MHCQPATASAFQDNGRVVLVGFEDQDNLGTRYLSSYLRSFGHETRIVAITRGPEPILETIRDFRPHIVGFSLIFQYFVEKYAALLKRLRKAGVEAHFTMGGHYASFEHGALLEAIPELDSVVRFEGEETLLELTQSLSRGREWRQVAGIAFRRGREVITSEPRQGRRDLDELPWPDRDDIGYEDRKIPLASVLGGRGCPWKCSFCSIITFYDGNGTRGRRRRDPMRIVDELEYLHRQRGVRVILWQDDDFLAGGRLAVRWAHDIASECVARGLHHHLRWKFSCRSDEVKSETLEPLVEAGLTHVYLGVEAGDEADLKDMNKLLKPDVHLRAGEVLRGLGLSFDFGFMLLQPWSTIQSVRNNIQFLREFAGDGASAAGFCRMLPYVGTAVEARLKAEGRLKRRDLQADYSFLEPRLDAFYQWLLDTFEERNFTTSGTLNLLRMLLFHAHLDFPDRSARSGFRNAIHSITAMSNAITLDTVEAALDYFESASPSGKEDPYPHLLTRHHSRQDGRIRLDIASLLVRHPEVLEHLHVSR
ncbi:MAG: B12-binding domain-containing radical SAM protein [Acidobacteriota bacterium]